MTKEHPKFDFNEALEQLKAGKPISVLMGSSLLLTLERHLYSKLAIL